MNSKSEEMKDVEAITNELVKRETMITNNWKLYCQKKLQIKYIEA